MKFDLTVNADGRKCHYEGVNWEFVKTFIQNHKNTIIYLKKSVAVAQKEEIKLHHLSVQMKKLKNELMSAKNKMDELYIRSTNVLTSMIELEK